MNTPVISIFLVFDLLKNRSLRLNKSFQKNSGVDIVSIFMKERPFSDRP